MKNFNFESSKMLSGMSDEMLEALSSNHAIIAGGIVSRVFSGRSIEGADIDVYFRNSKDLAETLYKIEGTKDIVFDYTDKSIMIKSDDTVIQFIIIDYFQEPKDIFERFDFTCVMGAYDIEKDEFEFHPDFLLHNAQRKLVYNPKTMFPIISALRVDKYKREGYNISKMEYLKILISIMGLAITSWDEAEKQFGKFYGTSLANVIREETKKKEFSVPALLEEISIFEFEYEKTGTKEFGQKNISNFDKFVTEITGYKPSVYKWGNNKYFKIRNDIKIVVNDYSVEKYGQVFIDTVDTSKVYKYVKEKDGVLYSNFKNSFKYVIGENAVDNSNGLFFYYRSGMSCCKSEYKFEKRVMIECEVVKYKHGGDLPETLVVCSEVKVLRIVPDSEVDAIIKDLEDDSLHTSLFPF